MRFISVGKPLSFACRYFSKSVFTLYISTLNNIFMAKAEFYLRFKKAWTMRKLGSFMCRVFDQLVHLFYYFWAKA